MTGPALALAWMCYLSLVTVGQDFLSFQWDILLLEAGFLVNFPGSVAPARASLALGRLFCFNHGRVAGALASVPAACFFRAQ